MYMYSYNIVVFPALLQRMNCDCEIECFVVYSAMGKPCHYSHVVVAYYKNNIITNTICCIYIYQHVYNRDNMYIHDVHVHT